MADDLEGLLEELSNAPGVTGHEEAVRSIVRRELSPVADAVEVDGLGSLLGRIDGTDGAPRVLLTAHMDELGLLVRRVTDEGFLTFQPIGGWLDQAIVNQRWVVQTRLGPVLAVSGIKTVHVMQPKERERVFERGELFLDVGAADRADATERLGIRPGDPVVPESRFAPLAGGRRYVGKAWDDRVGVAVLLLAARELAQERPSSTVIVAATVQEEVGLRGAQTVAHRADPDIAINLESGVAGDYPGITPDEAQERLGAGPTLFLHDSSMLPNLALRNLVEDVAGEAGIPLQYNVLAGYGQDASAVQRSRGGVPAVNLAVPTRYLHSHTGVIDRGDVEQAVRLVVSLVRAVDETVAERLRAFD